VLKLLLQADRKSAQTLKQHLPLIIDGVEALASEADSDPRLASAANCQTAKLSGRDMMIGIVLSETDNVSADRLHLLQQRFPGRLAIDSVFVLPPRPSDYTAFETWCATRAKTMLEFVLGEYAASQLATAGLRRHTEQLERSLAQAETVFTEFRREPLKLAYRAERAGTYALPLLRSEETGPQSLKVHQTVRRHIANIRYIDVFFNGDHRNVEGTVRFTVQAAWSGKVLCDASVDLCDLGPSWTQFRCEPLACEDEQPLAIELHMSGPDLGWLSPAFSHVSPIPEECATIAGHNPIGRPLALQIWSGIPGIEQRLHAGSFGASQAADPAGFGPAVANSLSIAPEQLGRAELASKLPADLTFAPVNYDTATQSLLVHPLGFRPTVARLPPMSVSNLSALSAIVQLNDPNAQPTEFALTALPASGRGRVSASWPPSEDIDLSGVTWHEFKAREWGEVEVCFPQHLDGEIQIYLLTRTRSDSYNYTSAWFRGLKMTCWPVGGAE
jgi:hypothetical protein